MMLSDVSNVLFQLLWPVSERALETNKRNGFFG